MENVIETAARRLRDAAASGVAGEPVRGLLGESATPAGAYAVQRVNHEASLAAGRRVSGHKAGLTNTAVQGQLGIDEPVWGVLYADRCRNDGDEIDIGELNAPRVEVEAAVVLGADLDAAPHTLVDVIGATAYVLPALEIVDSRVEGWDITAVDLIADNVSAALYVLGSRPVPLSALDLRRIPMSLSVDGEQVATGTGAAVLGNPLYSVLWLADALCRNGTPLRAGECIMTGSMCPMRPIGPGDEIEATIEGLGTVSAQLSG